MALKYQRLLECTAYKAANRQLGIVDEALTMCEWAEIFYMAGLEDEVSLSAECERKASDEAVV
jgi:hypothetical protein